MADASITDKSMDVMGTEEGGLLMGKVADGEGLLVGMKGC